MACALVNMINCQIESDTFQLSQIVVRPSEFKSSFRSQKKERQKLCYVSLVTCHMSCVGCHMSHVTFPLSPNITATATDPPLANSPTMNSRLVHQDRTNKTKKALKAPYWYKIILCGIYCDLLGKASIKNPSSFYY